MAVWVVTWTGIWAAPHIPRPHYILPHFVSVILTWWPPGLYKPCRSHGSCYSCCLATPPEGRRELGRWASQHVRSCRCHERATKRPGVLLLPREDHGKVAPRGGGAPWHPSREDKHAWQPGTAWKLPLPTQSFPTCCHRVSSLHRPRVRGTLLQHIFSALSIPSWHPLVKSLEN